MSKEEYLKLYKKLRRIERLLKLSTNSPIPLKQAVKYTGFSKSHLYKLNHAQLIPHYKPKGKMVFYLKSDLDKFLLQNRVSTIDEILSREIKPIKRSL